MPNPPDQTKTLRTKDFTSTDQWDTAVSALYAQGYVFFFSVPDPAIADSNLSWVTFGGYPKPGRLR